MTSIGLPYRDVAVEGELGPMPAWLLEPRQANGRWAVLVPAVAPPDARNACALFPPCSGSPHLPGHHVPQRPDRPPAPDGRYNLGLSEWRDVESALEAAAAAGASGVVLGGWSMGGAVVLQTLKQTAMVDFVDAVFLDARWWTGSTSWPTTPDCTTSRRSRDLGTLVMGRRATRHLVGVHDPVDVALTNWVARADEIRHRILIQHSVDDEFVPAGLVLALAEARPDLVTLEPWDTARHWRVEPRRVRWERVLADFLTR